MKKLIVFTDGASRGNPGPASYGFVIIDSSGKHLEKVGEKIGVATNNFAEYSAVLEALRLISQKHKNTSLAVDFYMDSKLVVEQLSGRYKIKSLNLKPLIDQIRILENSLGKVSYHHIPRTQNKEADLLANMALDGLV